MCRFHILGCCSRGDACHFAHQKEELLSQPDLFRTKLCKTLIQTGHCNEDDCRYAHSKEELRLVLGFNCQGLGMGGPPPGGPGAATEARSSAPGMRADRHQEQRTPQFPVPSALHQFNAVHQMAEAAKAHAAEAVRLQAMATYLEAHSTAARAALGASGFPAGLALAGGAGGGGHPAFGGPAFPHLMQPLAPGMAAATCIKSNISLAGAVAAHTGPAWGNLLDTRVRGNRGPVSKDLVAAAAPRLPAQAPPEARGCHAADQTGPAARAAAPRSALAPMHESFQPSEPAQINPLTLRSLSKEDFAMEVSLADAAEEATAAAAPTPRVPAAAGAAHGTAPTEDAYWQRAEGAPAGSWTVKNTFLDFETQQTSPLLRTSRSAAARLYALAEGSGQDSPELGPLEAPEDFGLAGGGIHTPRTQPALCLLPEHDDCTAGAAADALGKPGGGAATAPPLPPPPPVPPEGPEDLGAPGAPSPAKAADAADVAECSTPADLVEQTEVGAGSPRSSNGGCPWLPTSELVARGGAPLLANGLGALGSVRGITVKNTFLDFATSEPAKLRTVHTFAGCLDQMGD